MERSHAPDEQTSEEKRKNAIRKYCRQQLPLKKTAARINAQKEAAAEAKVTPLRTLHRCKSPPQPLRDTRARRSTCPTCVAFAEREALRTNTGRARRVSGPGYKARGKASKVSVHAQPDVLSHLSGAHEAPPGTMDPCVVRKRNEEAKRDPERMPARGPMRWQRRKCLPPQILNRTISDVPWGGTPGARLVPERAPRIIPSHPLERRAKCSPEYWHQQFDKLEDEVRGPAQAVTQMWDALTPNILHRIGPILDIPMPTARLSRDDYSYSYASTEAPFSEEKSDERPIWETMSLPDEIPEMNITPSDPAFKDWQYAEVPAQQPSGFSSFGFYRNERHSLHMAVLAPDRHSKTDRFGLTPTKSARTLSPPKRRSLKVQLPAETKDEDEKREEVGTAKTGEGGEEKEILVQDLVESKRFIKIHEHFDEVGRDTHEDYRMDLTWSAPRDKEHEGEFVSPEYQEMKMERDSKDAWDLEKYFSATYIEERRRLVGTEQLNREMWEYLNLLDIDMDVHPPTLYPREDGLFSIPGRPNNPYFNFLQKPRKKAAIWREHFKPEASGEAMDAAVLLHPELSLLEKADHISSKITSEFMDWVKGLGGVQPTELNEELIQQLFDVTFDMPAAKSLCVRVRELPVVTKQVADACFARDGEEQEGLRRELQSDLAAEKRGRHLVAFDKLLERCCPQRFLAPQNKVRRTWIECHVPEDLTSSRFVFEGITHLVSVQRFCEWLDRHPNQEPPSYLRAIGMVGPEAQHYRTAGAKQSVRLRSRMEASRVSSFFMKSFARPNMSYRGSPSLRESSAAEPRGTSARMTERESLSAKKLNALHKSLTESRKLAIL